MTQWDIKVLYYGKITSPVEIFTPALIHEPGDTIDGPVMGFLLQSGDRNILVDCGIADSFFIDGKAWGGFPGVGGRSYVLNSLKKHGVTPQDIEMVLYTHLHNDHAGACDQFTKAVHVFQRDEWTNLLDPLPVQRKGRDYDTDVIPILAGLKTIKVNGDLEVLPGIKLYKAPGHSLGSQLITVETAKGNVVLIGDLCNNYARFFPDSTEQMDMYGKRWKVRDPEGNVKLYGPAVPFILIYDYWTWYDSVHKAKALSQNKRELVMPGHEHSLITEFRKQEP